ncbi:hypothetical protein P691DRAFT_793167 [Macrolepiota fuliginosa MF-IS2]|uniref:LYR motif-containing protein Cup1-like N-terminal domain-containing protein n=1 Tax=Macrolepiota fuliginosa MF-IS2 TaxID=1400762 RepID=A0A9P5XBS2_9AGAR|nr:hypothetical protein P691DRAFT_793167 [Macrolepiota fuliginosa MF-IS2]
MSKPLPLLSLYRSYQRVIRQLPHNYLRQFYQLKARDDLENLRDTKPPSLQRKKFKRISKEVRKMSRGLHGDWRSFDHILDIAYGRKGKLKHELMEPFISDPNAQVPPPIIQQTPLSRPPVYSPELRALLTSDISRTTKALKPSSLSRPPNFPPQADPLSEEARLFGTLSKRRHKNILQRYFKQEVQKVYPPLEVKTSGGRTLEDAGARGGAGQGLSLLKDIETLVGPPWKPPPLTRRERQALGDDATLETSLSSSQRHPSRWLRRRFQSLLGRIPILTFTPGQKSGTGRYSVERSPKFLGDLYTTGGRLLPVASATQLAWHQPILTEPKNQGKKGKS